jgi:small multidrug resistance pump
MVKNWLFLLVAIVSEVVATSSLKSSESFSRFWPSVVAVIGYGIVLITVFGWFLFDQKLDLPAILGIGLIAMGVVVMNVFSKTMGN